MDSKSISSLQSLGERLKELRLERGFSTLAQLSSRCGVSAAQLSRIESGKQKNPRSETIQRIAKALNIEPSELVSEEDLKYVNRSKVFVGAVHAIWSAPLILMSMEAQKELALSLVTFSVLKGSEYSPFLQSSAEDVSQIESGPQYVVSDQARHLKNELHGKKPYLAGHLFGLRRSQELNIDFIASAAIGNDSRQAFLECGTVMHSVSGVDVISNVRDENGGLDAEKINELMIGNNSQIEIKIFFPERTFAEDLLTWFGESRLEIAKKQWMRKSEQINLVDIDREINKIVSCISSGEKFVVILWEPFTSWLLAREDIKAKVGRATIVDLAGARIENFPEVEMKVYLDKWSYKKVVESEILRKFIDSLCNAVDVVEKLKRLERADEGSDGRVLSYLAEYLSMKPEDCLRALRQCRFGVKYSVDWVHDHLLQKM